MDAWDAIWILIWIAALVFAIWVLVRRPDGTSVHEDALAILRARFARGEIGEQEFERARNVLRADSPGGTE